MLFFMSLKLTQNTESDFSIISTINFILLSAQNVLI